VTLKHVESLVSLFDKQSGKQIVLPYGLIAKKSYNKIILFRQSREDNKQENKDNNKACSLLYGINTYLVGKTQIRLNVESVDTFLQKAKNSCTIYIDCDKIRDSLKIRFRQPGDYIVTENGTKTLKKYFIDEKIPKEERDHTLVIADQSEIVWIPGRRVNLHYYVTEHTKNILKIECME
jgi:tRNA(Ile)-lysidine synthase